MNRPLILTVLIFCILMPFSCSKNGYERALSAYLDDLIKGRLDAAYSMLTDSDKSVYGFKEFKKDEDSSVIGRIIRGKVRYKIISSKLSQTGITANIQTEINQIDLVKLYELLPELADENLTENDRQKIFRENGLLADSTRLKKTVTYKLVKENSVWRIAADFARKKRLRELLDRANEFYKGYDYKKSLDCYNDALSFNNYDEEAIEGSLKVREKLNYIAKYVSVEYKLLESGNGSLCFGIRIGNKGTIAIKKVMLEFGFKNGSGSVGNTRAPFNSEGLAIGYQDELYRKVYIKNIREKYSSIDCRVTGIVY